jgi:hypothetical protein
VSAFRRALTWTKSSGLMREGLSAPESLDGNIRKEVIRRRQRRQRDCRIWLDEEGEVARESRAAIRKRIVTVHPSSPLMGCVTRIVSNLFSKTEFAQNHASRQSQRPCLQGRRLQLLIGRGWKLVFDLQDFLWCVLSEQALHIGRKFPQQIANRIRAQGASKAV